MALYLIRALTATKVSYQASYTFQCLYCANEWSLRCLESRSLLLSPDNLPVSLKSTTLWSYSITSIVPENTQLQTKRSGWVWGTDVTRWSIKFQDHKAPSSTCQDNPWGRYASPRRQYGTWRSLGPGPQRRASQESYELDVAQKWRGLSVEQESSPQWH